MQLGVLSVWPVSARELCFIMNSTYVTICSPLYSYSSVFPLEVPPGVSAQRLLADNFLAMNWLSRYIIDDPGAQAYH